MTENATLIRIAPPTTEPTASRLAIPRIVAGAGIAAAFAWDEFFRGSLRNPHTRTAYLRAVRRLLGWLPAQLRPHSFRVATMTDLLSQGVPLADVQYLASHSDPRTTRLYDRWQRAVSCNLVERISI